MTEYQKLLNAGAHLKALPHYVRATATRVGLAYEQTCEVERACAQLFTIVSRKEETK